MTPHRLLKANYTAQSVAKKLLFMVGKIDSLFTPLAWLSRIKGCVEQFIGLGDRKGSNAGTKTQFSNGGKA